MTCIRTPLRSIAAAALLALPAAAEASYIFAAATPVGPAFKMSFLEPGTVITTPAGTKTAWSSEYMLDGGRIRVLEEYDCGGRRIRALELQVMGAGNSVRTLRQPGVLSTFPATGFAARKHALVCTGRRDAGQAVLDTRPQMEKVAIDGLNQVRAKLGGRR